VHIIARPWPQSGLLFPRTTSRWTFRARSLSQWPDRAQWSRARMPSVRPCLAMPVAAAQCTTARLGARPSLTIREDEQFQQKPPREDQDQTRTGFLAQTHSGGALRLAHHVAHAGDAPLQGTTQESVDGRRHAASATCMVAARYAEEVHLVC